MNIYKALDLYLEKAEPIGSRRFFIKVIIFRQKQYFHVPPQNLDSCLIKFPEFEEKGFHLIYILYHTTFC